MPYCTKCGKEVSTEAAFCSNCGNPLKRLDQPQLHSPPQPMPTATSPPTQTVILESKNPGTAAVLAFILGMFGFWGVGHLYVGKIGKGLVLLILGIIISALGWLSLVSLGFFGAAALFFPVLGLGLVFALVIVLVDLVGWIWQTFDAYNLAKQFNSYVQQYGRTPW